MKRMSDRPVAKQESNGAPPARRLNGDAQLCGGGANLVHDVRVHFGGLIENTRNRWNAYSGSLRNLP
jgi:hypothetical protein